MNNAQDLLDDPPALDPVSAALVAQARLLEDAQRAQATAEVGPGAPRAFRRAAVNHQKRGRRGRKARARMIAVVKRTFGPSMDWRP